jgi:hypothetical protein
VIVCGDARLTLIDGVEKPDELAEDLMANLAETSHIGVDPEDSSGS